MQYGRPLRLLERVIDVGTDGQWLIQVAATTEDLTQQIRRFVLALAGLAGAAGFVDGEGLDVGGALGLHETEPFVVDGFIAEAVDDDVDAREIGRAHV